MRHNSLPFLILNHPIIIFPLNENPWPWSQKVNCGPIMPGHILFLTALPPLPPYHDLAPSLPSVSIFLLLLHRRCAETEQLFLLLKADCFGDDHYREFGLDWISQDVVSCRNSTASKVYKEERFYFPRLRTWATSLYWWELGEKKVKGIQKKGTCGENKVQEV